jgi:hypothetical protein
VENAGLKIPFHDSRTATLQTEKLPSTLGQPSSPGFVVRQSPLAAPPDSANRREAGARWKDAGEVILRPIFAGGSPRGSPQPLQKQVKKVGE